ncbi:endonuclease-reverse transcriptase [Elysia marginata]|uniref:Endonuclease-reverse transcriptase n=1 Tax=Elysia marginata TaxID=1093978 RepID=A0AAV4F7K7_9GAST|nr:endonuclease-reverse transcriptase [Elysia marginata]
MGCQKGLNLCFIDYAEAFVRVNHEKLLEALAKAGIPSHERRLVCEIYWNLSTKVKLTSGTTEDIMIQRGFKRRYRRSKCGATGDFSRYHGQKKTNKEIIQMADVSERLLQQLMTRKLRYAGHIMRGSSGPLLQLSLEGKIEGNRGQGRSRTNWMDNVEKWSRSTSYGDTKRKAENREKWRDIVANLWTRDGT